MQWAIVEDGPVGEGRPGRLDGVRKIAVLRANALGDLIFSVPALEALRAAYPGAEIVLLGRDWHRRFLEGRPGPVDRVVVVPPARGVTAPHDHQDDPDGLEPFFARMRRERFDLALQIHGGGRHSNPFVRRLGARVTAGGRTEEAEPLDRWVGYVYFQNEVSRYLEVVSLVGAAPVTLEPRVTVIPADLAEAGTVVPPDARPLAVLHPGVTDPRRRWPPERFVVVGDALAEAGARVVLTGVREEAGVVSEVATRMQAPAEELSGRLSVGGLAGLLSRAAVVVANDTGPLHLARAVGSATVGIYWCGNFVNGGPLTRNRHRAAISWRTRCPVCDVDCLRHRCDHRESFTLDVTVEEVLPAALALLAAAGAPDRGMAEAVAG